MNEHETPVHRLADDLGIIAHELHELDVKLHIAVIELALIVLGIAALVTLRSIELFG